MVSRKLSLAAGGAVLVLGILACTINVGGPAYPTPRIPVSTEAIRDLQNALGTASAEGDANGTITLTITQEQLTSYLAYQLQTQSNPIMTDPQVYLQDGQIQIYGTVRRGDFLATMFAAVDAGVDDQGQLKITLKSADIGPIPVPKSLGDAITSSIQAAYTSAVGPVVTGFRLDTITIGAGTMTVTGSTK